MGSRAAAFLVAFVFIAAGFVGVLDIVLGQKDTFDSDLQGWATGGSSPVPTLWDSTGGPAGSGDGFLLQATTGDGGPGAKLVVMNTTQWAGDYVSAGVKSVTMDVNNLGATALELRLYIESTVGNLISTSGIAVPTSSGWVSVAFPIDSTAMTFVNGTDYSAIMSNVSRLRIIHGVSTLFPPVDVDGLLGVDNVTSGGALPSSVVEEKNESDALAIESVYPNPADARVFVDVVSPAVDHARVTVVDLLGRKVLTAYDGRLVPGRTVVPIVTSDLAAGLYVVRVESGSRMVSEVFSIVR